MPNSVLLHMNKGFTTKKLVLYLDKPNTWESLKLHNSLVYKLITTWIWAVILNEFCNVKHATQLGQSFNKKWNNSGQ